MLMHIGDVQIVVETSINCLSMASEIQTSIDSVVYLWQIKAKQSKADQGKSIMSSPIPPQFIPIHIPYITSILCRKQIKQTIESKPAQGIVLFLLNANLCKWKQDETK
jgi:hypothetical protein